MTQFKTLQFPNTAKGQAAKIRALEQETANGWRVVSETIVPGKFKGANACCLFLIFAPCAFLAGHEDDIITITLEKDDFSDSTDLPATSSSPTTPSSTFNHARWNALLEYDQEIRAAAEPLRGLDPKWMEEFGTAYMVLNEKQYLAEIVRRILERVRLEEAEKERLRQLERQRIEAVREQRVIEEQARERDREARKRRFALLLKPFWGTAPRKIVTIGLGLTLLVVVLVIGDRSLHLRGLFAKAPSESTKGTQTKQQQSAASPIGAAHQEQQSTMLTAPTSIAWNAKTDGDPKTYRIGDLNITLGAVDKFN